MENTSETTKEISHTNSTLTALNVLSTCGNWKKKKIPTIKWIIMCIIQGAPKVAFENFPYQKKIGLLKHLNDKICWIKIEIC